MTHQPIIPVEQAKLPLFLAVDVGGTSIKLAVVDDQGATLGFRRVTTNPHSPGHLAIERVGKELDSLIAELQIDRPKIVRAGLGSPGTMDIPRGMLLEPPNLPGWYGFEICRCLTEATGLEVTFANDAAAAAYGEYWLGSGSQHHSIIMLTLGTGVGGGIIYHDQSIDGEHSHGSECGHVIVDSRPEARICSCGKSGHLEAYASATALVARTCEALDAGQPSRLADLPAGRELTALSVAEAAEAGDALALNIIDETADWLAIGMVSMAHTIDPDAIVLGGAMNFGGHGAALGERFLQRIRSRFAELAFPVVAQCVQIEFAQLAGDAGYLGAAGLARTAYHSQHG